MEGELESFCSELGEDTREARPEWVRSGVPTPAV